MRCQLIALHLTIFAGAFVSLPAAADANCRRVPGLSTPIQAFLLDAGAVHAAGGGVMPLKDFLIGITDISHSDMQELKARAPIAWVKETDAGGKFSNAGPQDISFQGIFASTETYFRIPRTVRGTYSILSNGVQIVYDPQYRMEVGEKILGMKAFRSINHTVTTANQLTFFFGSNASGDPDRCYLATDH
jgi:hypothetical protein